MNKKGEISFGSIVATLGSILIGLGVLFLMAINWRVFSDVIKILIAIISTTGAYSAGVMLRIYDYKKIGESLLLLGAILFTWTIFLIAQIFHLSLSLQSNANLWLISFVVLFVIAYIFTSTSTLVIALAEFLVWIQYQFSALVNIFRWEFGIGYFAIAYLLIAMLLYGLTQIHKSQDHEFTETYRFWTGFYTLLVAYILSFQRIIPLLWATGTKLAVGPVIFLLVLFAISFVIFVIGITAAYDKNKLTIKEIITFVAFIFVYIAIIALAGLFSGEGTNFSSTGLSPGLWLLWLFDNIIFILVILSVIGYGVRYKSNQLVNLSIAFFVLDIVTRYIGFILDLRGQNMFAILSIIGGIIFIFGGWGIEKWRKKLIQNTEVKNDIGYKIN